MIRLDINTTDQDFLTDLQAAKIESIHISRRMEASSPEQQWLLITVQIAITAAPLLIRWLSERLPQKTTHKTTINNVDVSHNTGQVQTIINQQIHIYQNQIANDDTKSDKR